MDSTGSQKRDITAAFATTGKQERRSGLWGALLWKTFPIGKGRLKREARGKFKFLEFLKKEFGRWGGRVAGTVPTDLCCWACYLRSPEHVRSFQLTYLLTFQNYLWGRVEWRQAGSGNWYPWFWWMGRESGQQRWHFFFFLTPTFFPPSRPASMSLLPALGCWQDFSLQTPQFLQMVAFSTAGRMRKVIYSAGNPVREGGYLGTWENSESRPLFELGRGPRGWSGQRIGFVGRGSVLDRCYMGGKIFGHPDIQFTQPSDLKQPYRHLKLRARCGPEHLEHLFPLPRRHQYSCTAL